MKILPNTQRLGKLTFDSNQVKKSKTNPNVLIAKASDGKDYGVVRKSDGSYDYAGSSRNATFGDRMATASANPNIANRILDTAGLLMSEPQRMMTRKLTNNKYNTPSEVVANSKLSDGRLKNTLGFAADVVADPTNLVGAGIAKSVIKGGLKKVGSKTLATNVDNIIKPPTFSVNNEGKGLTTQENLVTSLKKELSEKGIVQSQKTPNLPWKEPIRKGVNPWGYDMQDKIQDVKSLFVNSKNKNYVPPKKLDRVYQTYLNTRKAGSELLSKEDFLATINQDHFFKTTREVVDNRFANRFGEQTSLANKNRHATWDMYLGKPQTKHPMYDISDLTKSKDDVIYTIKEEFINKPAIENRFNGMLESIDRNLPGKNWTKKDNSWIIPDKDGDLFGTMGGFHWKVDKLPNGNYKAIANDVWDIQPLKDRILGDSDKLSGRLLNKAVKPIENIEVGKALGIGNPLNVKVGFIIDGKTKKIINTFGLALAAIATGAADSTMNKKDNNNKFKYGGKLLPLLNKF